MSTQFTLNRKLLTKAILSLLITLSLLTALFSFPEFVNAAVSNTPADNTEDNYLLAQADIPEDINPNANVSTSTVDPSEVSTTSTSRNTTGSNGGGEDAATPPTDDFRTGGSGWVFWVALAGLLIVVLLYRTSGSKTDDSTNETVQ